MDKSIVEMVKNGDAFLADAVIDAVVSSYKNGQIVTIEWCTPVHGLHKADANQLFAHYRGQFNIGIDYNHRADVISAKENGYAPSPRTSWKVYENSAVFHHKDDPTRRYLMVNLVDKSPLFHEWLNGNGEPVTREEIALMGLGYVLEKKDKQRAEGMRPDKPVDKTRTLKFAHIMALGRVASEG